MLVVGYNQGKPKKGLELRPFAEAALARTGPDPVLRAKLLNTVAILKDELGEYEHAQELYRESLAIRKRQLGETHPLVAASYNNLGDSLRLQGKLRQARDHLQKSLDLKVQTLGREHPDVAYSAQNLGVVLIELGELDEAKRYTQLAIERFAAIRPTGSSPPVELIENLGIIAIRQGAITEATRLLKQAVDLNADIRSSHPRTAAALHSLGLAYYAGKDYSSAEKVFGRAVEIRKQVLGEHHHLVAAVYVDLAAVCLWTDKRTQAKRWLALAAEVQSNANEVPAIEVVARLLTYGDLQWQEGNSAAARGSYEEALSQARGEFGFEHPWTASALAGVARTVEQTDLARARHELERAVAIFSVPPGFDHQRRSEAMFALAQLQRQSDATRAIELARTALAGFRRHPRTERRARAVETWLSHARATP